jgi:hypothetical protein
MGTKKMRLERPQVVGGKVYGRGEVEVDDSVARMLKGEDLPASAAPTETPSGGLPEDLEQFTIVELKDRAKESGIEGYSTMKKDQLIDALKGSVKK